MTQELAPQQTSTTDGKGLLPHLAGKYLMFALSEERYGVQILKVQEIIGMITITRVPRTEDFLKGVINLRGKIIPVVDLRQKFGLPEIPHDARTCIVVVEVLIDEKPSSVGVIVDTVLEVRAFGPDQIEPAPEYGGSFKTNFIVGIGRAEDNNVTMLIDIERALTESGLEILEVGATGSKE